MLTTHQPTDLSEVFLCIDVAKYLIAVSCLKAAVVEVNR